MRGKIYIFTQRKTSKSIFIKMHNYILVEEILISSLILPKLGRLEIK